MPMIYSISEISRTVVICMSILFLLLSGKPVHSQYLTSNWTPAKQNIEYAVFCDEQIDQPDLEISVLSSSINPSENHIEIFLLKDVRKKVIIPDIESFLEKVDFFKTIEAECSDRLGVAVTIVGRQADNMTRYVGQILWSDTDARDVQFRESEIDEDDWRECYSDLEPDTDAD